MFEVHASLTGHQSIDFDKKRIRKELRQLGGVVRKDARKLVARRAVSRAGEDPGKDSGAMQRSIKAKTYKTGMAARIAPQKTAEMGPEYYPAFLMYGVRNAGSPGWRIEPRNNFMITALEGRREMVRDTLTAALKTALKPR
jgi:hypothetical protein